MALVKCPECGNKVSAQAAACPQCGCPGDQLRKAPVRSSDKRLLVGCAGALLLVLIVQLATRDHPAVATGPRPSRPPAPESGATPANAAVVPSVVPSADQIEAAIAASDDFSLYKEQFILASTQLITVGRCSLEQLREYGGWVKSQTHKTDPVYFTYCGEAHVSNRIYLNVATGEVFQ